MFAVHVARWSCVYMLAIQSSVHDVPGMVPTKRAFSRQVTTSSGKRSDMVGFWESAECCQLRGGCASAMVSLPEVS